MYEEVFDQLNVAHMDLNIEKNQIKELEYIVIWQFGLPKGTAPIKKFMEEKV